MSEELFMKSVMSVIISGILAYDCWVREKRETEPESKDENRPRYATTIPVLMSMVLVQELVEILVLSGQVLQ